MSVICIDPCNPQAGHYIDLVCSPQQPATRGFSFAMPTKQWILAMALGSQIPDKTLLRSVTQKLTQRSSGSGSKLSVTVISGTVTLSGSLGQEYQRKAIISSMNTITGVKRVIDQMKVAPPKKREDK